MAGDSMSRYYWRLARKAPGLAMTAWNGAAGVIGAIVILLFMLNREAADAVANWEGISPWWALLPAATLFVLGLLKANHQEFRQLQERYVKLYTDVRTLSSKLAAADSATASEIAAALARLTSFLRSRSDQAPGSEIVSQRAEAEAAVVTAVAKCMGMSNGNRSQSLSGVRGVIVTH